MEMPELPRRIHTLGEEPPAMNIISYHTCWTLHTALKKALHDDEYEELKESKLGVFIKFQELGFDWASRLVHYMLGFQLDIKKKYELWSLVGLEPVRFSLLEFENLTGLNIEDLEKPHFHVKAGPSTQEIIAAFERCEGWSRDDRKRLAYLAIFTGYIKGRKYSTPTRDSLARLVMELERFENYPWGRVAFKVLMDSVKGKDISGCYIINGFAQALQAWVYTALLELGANYGNPLPKNSSPPILAYKGRKGRRFFKEAILSQKEDARYQEKRDAALAFFRAKSDRTRKLASSQQSPYTANITAKVIIPNKNLYPGYNPFAPIDKKKLKELADWLETFIIENLSIKNHVQVELGGITSSGPHLLRVVGGLYDLPIIRLHIDAWINVLRKRYDANPQHFRSERMCLLDHLFAQQWRFNYKDFKDSEPDQNGLGRRLSGGAWNYYAGTIPSFCQSNKVWGTDIDDVYAPMNYADTHWIAMWILIPKRHIVVWDSICSSISPEELDVPNRKTMRDNMAVDIFKELPDAHEFENKVNDANLGAYEG
uniref:Ubiquitin-like protease family profile domain-containing protein n=1 Tax=Brassica oleracea var. oleracea TaxID=109376 RepID=A0A0D3BY97_BRAOL